MGCWQTPEQLHAIPMFGVCNKNIDYWKKKTFVKNNKTSDRIYDFEKKNVVHLQALVNLLSHFGDTEHVSQGCEFSYSHSFSQNLRQAPTNSIKQTKKSFLIQNQSIRCFIMRCSEISMKTKSTKALCHKIHRKGKMQSKFNCRHYYDKILGLYKKVQKDITCIKCSYT